MPDRFVFDTTWDGTVTGTTMTGTFNIVNLVDGAPAGGTFNVTRV